MKYFSCIIIFLLSGINSNAQISLKDTIHVSDGLLLAVIETNLSSEKKDIPTLLFISDGSSNHAKLFAQNEFDSLLIAPPERLNKIQISFFQDGDPFGSTASEMTANFLMYKVLPEIIKRHPNLSTKDFILSGLNEGAGIVIYASALFPQNIDKRGIFIDNYSSSFLMKDKLDLLIPKMKGKFFICTQNEEKDNFATAFADSLALNPGVMIYKIDEPKANTGKNIFTEFYKWSVADGNNYIINIKQ